MSQEIKSMSFLLMRNISKNFAGVKALENVEFAIDTGEIHCLAGENGSGKSTLIKIITGVYRPEHGAQIFVDSKYTDHLTPTSAIEKGIAVIYQDLSLFPNLSVEENIYLGYAIHEGNYTINRRKAHQIAEAATARIGVKIPLKVKVEDLSIAEKQLVAICRAFTRNTKLLIMDEPTTALTRKEVDALFNVVADLKSKCISTLFVSHKLDEVFEIAERVTVLRDGKLIGRYPASELDHHKLTFLMTGQKIETSPMNDAVIQKEVCLDIKGLSLHGHFRNINLELRLGEVLGITGLLGSGRTELALALFGLTPPPKGEILLDGKKYKPGNSREAVNRGLAYVTENRLLYGLVLPQSINSNIVLATIDRITNSLGIINQKKRKEIAALWINKLGVKTASDLNPASSLSGGNQQKVVLAKWLATGPKVLILDSPTAGIDVAAKESIHKYVRELSEKGVAIILISDELHEIMANSHRVAVMHRGSIMKYFNPKKDTMDDVQKYINTLE
jgi:simple sugar transport system ATP-binding protein